ncbi:hypothetical protein DPMN_178111 [Dreissena polymorpha]|uniref:Uncharacterized protein n=1 Tax=Dreissena polymorpha TaxID=45954 RepID=A0A9D4EC89_DREPO|nr:hypothetical protein DPMN_178111 [Dreissena polymorpha]
MWPLALTKINAPPPGGHVFQQTRTIFEIIQDVIRTNVLTKKNATPLAAMFFNPSEPFMNFQDITGTNKDRTIKKSHAPGGHNFQATRTIFELIQDIIGINLLIKFHEDWTINLPGGHVFQATKTIFNWSKCHDDWTINVDSSVSKPCISTNRNHFQLVQDIIGTNLLTNFYEDNKCGL